MSHDLSTSRAAEIVSEIVEDLGHVDGGSLDETATGYARRAELEHPITRAPSSVAAAAVYLAGLAEGWKLTQEDIAESAGVSAKAIRDAYPEIASAEDILPGINRTTRHGRAPTEFGPRGRTRQSAGGEGQ